MAAEEWDLRKEHGESSSALDELMQFQGLEEVKRQFLDIKSKVDICKEQDPEGEMDILKLERFSVVFQGNPGTGKTTIARLYAKFLQETGILESDHVEETSGVKAAIEGARGMKSMIENMNDEEGGGVIFVDEAYQLMAPYVGENGKQTLDVILTELEKNIDTLASIFVGYKDQMEPFFEHNPGLESRIPYVVSFPDFNDGELWHILKDKINKHYHGRMRVEGGLDGLYMRIVVRRLAQGRGNRGFGNARAVENLLARIRQRQARRLARDKKRTRQVKGSSHKLNYFLFTKEDLIGPNASIAARNCPAWVKLRNLIGLEEVKKSAEQLIGMIELNHQRELLVLKTPSDFIGTCLGESEAKTKRILESTVGKVLVIDEAYMLDTGDSHDQDKYKTGVIDTIVAMTQGVPGEDRCIILVGYKDQIRTMFRNVNPGLSRRFPIERPFHFQNFTIDQLEQILRLKMIEDDLIFTDDAILAARDIFTRSLMRPNFTNAGEVNNVLAAAKMNYETRLSCLPLYERLFATALAATDFDPDFYRRESSRLDLKKILHGLIDSRIIDKLVGYQNNYRAAVRLNANPRTFVPTNFIFKGPPGTGKKTTAYQMGKIFYDMGYISTEEVVECSVTDLIGQYVGHTAPKARKKFQEGQGHVLIIGEAGRLVDGPFAAEAVEELLLFLTNPTSAGKMVVILAGLTMEMDMLKNRYPKLSSLFPEQILFESILPDDCVKVLLRELEGSGIGIVVKFLTDPSTEDYRKVKDLFHSLCALPGWSNAHDIKNLAKQIIRQFISTADLSALHQGLPPHCITKCLEQAITERRDRIRIHGLTSSSSYPPVPVQNFVRQEMAPSRPRSDIRTAEREGGWALNTKVSIDTRTQHQDLSSYERPSQSITTQGPKVKAPEINENQQSRLNEDSITREDGVSNENWQKLCKAKKKSRSGKRILKDRLEQAQLELKSAEETKDEANIKVFQERLAETQKKVDDEEKVQKALKEMTRCVYGYTWVKQTGGYRCEGGSHFVSDEELFKKMA
ncbi:hypothetical protein ACHAQJ_000324 [Trichoderma viride]